jgi:hypothetical protein
MGFALAGGVGLFATTVLDAKSVHSTFLQRLNEAESHMFVLVSCKRCSALGRADVMS